MINTKSKQLGKLFFTLVDENKQDQSVKADLLQLGLKNYTIIPSFPQRTWPFWLYQQMKDDGKSYAMDNNFLSLSNLRYRNWTLLSQPGSDKSALVDRSGLLHIPKTEYSLDFWLKTKSDLFFPSQSDSAEQRYNAGTGLFETQYTLDDLTVTASQFYKQFPQDNDLVFSEYSVENRGKSVNSVSFFLAVRPFTHEGLASLTDIQYLQSKTVLLNQQIALILEQKPDNVVCSNHDDGDVSELIDKVELIFQSQCSQGMASAFLEYKLMLNPGETKRIYCKSVVNPSFKASLFQTALPPSKIKLKLIELSAFSHQKEKEQLTHSVSNLQKNTMQFRCPDEVWNRLFSTQKYLLGTALGKTQCLSGTYDAYQPLNKESFTVAHALRRYAYSADSLTAVFGPAYINALTKAIKAERVTASDLGQLFTQLASLLRLSSFSLTQDYFKSLEHCVQLFLKRLDQSNHKKMDIIFPKRSCEYTGNSYYFLADLIGMLEAINALNDIALQSKFAIGKQFARFKHLLSGGIQSFCDRVSDKVVFKKIVPATLTAYLTVQSVETLMRYYVLFPHEEERVRRTFDMIQEHYVQDGLVRSLLNPSGFPIKENCYYARLLALLGQESYACSTRLLSLNDSAHSFPDSIHALTKKGASIEGHSHNAAAYLLLQLMGLLVHDSGSELQLLPLVPDHWFFEGFYVDKLMTSQGPLSIKAELQDEHIYVSINFKAKPELKEFKLSLPSTVYAVKVGDRITEVQEPLINLSSSVTELMLFHK